MTIEYNDSRLRELRAEVARLVRSGMGELEAALEVDGRWVNVKFCVELPAVLEDEDGLLHV